MKIEKVENLVANFDDTTEYLIHIKKFKKTLNHGLISKKAHKLITFNEDVWPKPNIDMNTDLRKKIKNNF